MRSALHLLPHLRIASFTMYGIAIGILALWGYVTGVTPIIVAAFSAVATYIGFLDRVLRSDEEQFLVRAAKRVSEGLTGTASRAFASSFAALFIVLFVLFWPTVTAIVYLEDHGEPPLSEL